MATTMTALPPHGVTRRLLHWAAALLVAGAWIAGATMEEFPRGPQRAAALDLHASLGLLVLGLAAARVIWLAVAPPEPLPGQPMWQRASAWAMHAALIAATIGLPLTGLLDRWARGRAVTAFGGVPLPAPFEVPGGKLWGETHEVVANLLLALVIAHIAAALWHQFVLKDGTLARMGFGRAPRGA